jgi:predicted deacylase
MNEFFPADYFAARASFRARAARAGARLTAHAIAATGPGGEELTIDVGWLGADTPRTLVMLTSAVHGVEGYAGSALQQLWLAEHARALPSHAAMLLVHAVNPYGFAHARRANERNVDLNRNALARFPGPANPAYARLDRWLNPTGAPRAADGFWLHALGYLLRYGRATLTQAIAGGQYHFPKGLFYGGQEREESVRLLAQLFAAPALQSARTVWHVDLHSGLGARGAYQFLLDCPPGSAEFSLFGNTFGADHVMSDRAAAASNYVASGTLTQLSAASFRAARVLTAVLEVGTCAPAVVLQALRAENRLHHYGCNDAQRAAAIRARLREALAPADPSWRAAVLAQGREIFGRLSRALESGLADAPQSLAPVASHGP